MSDIRFAPLFTGFPVTANTDPFAEACARAAQGCDPGLVVYRITESQMSAAIVFAPEVPLSEAAVLLPVCGIGLQNALGALAPPEVAVHLQWDGGIRVNGASCGQFSIAASTRDPQIEPDWVVVGFGVPLLTDSDDPGDAPDRTTLLEEGCGDVEPGRLLESWTKHTLVWINRWSDDGIEPVHAAWCGLACDIGKEITVMGHRGKFLGIDEHFGMLLDTGNRTELFPLTDLIREAA